MNRHIGIIQPGYEAWYRASPSFNGYFCSELKDGGKVQILRGAKVRDGEYVECAYEVEIFAGRAGIPARFILLEGQSTRAIVPVSERHTLREAIYSTPKQGGAS